MKETDKFQTIQTFKNHNWAQITFPGIWHSMDIQQLRLDVNGLNEPE